VGKGASEKSRLAGEAVGGWVPRAVPLPLLQAEAQGEGEGGGGRVRVALGDTAAGESVPAGEREPRAAEADPVREAVVDPETLPEAGREAVPLAESVTSALEPVASGESVPPILLAVGKGCTEPRMLPGEAVAAPLRDSRADGEAPSEAVAGVPEGAPERVEEVEGVTAAEALGSTLAEAEGRDEGDSMVAVGAPEGVPPNGFAVGKGAGEWPTSKLPAVAVTGAEGDPAGRAVGPVESDAEGERVAGGGCVWVAVGASPLLVGAKLVKVWEAEFLSLGAAEALRPLRVGARAVADTLAEGGEEAEGVEEADAFAEPGAEGEALGLFEPGELLAETEEVPDLLALLLLVPVSEGLAGCVGPSAAVAEAEASEAEGWLLRVARAEPEPSIPSLTPSFGKLAVHEGEPETRALRVEDVEALWHADGEAVTEAELENVRLTTSDLDTEKEPVEEGVREGEADAEGDVVTVGDTEEERLKEGDREEEGEMRGVPEGRADCVEEPDTDGEGAGDRDSATEAEARALAEEEGEGRDEGESLLAVGRLEGEPP